MGFQMGQNRRKVIPIVYKESALMREELPIITYISCIDYQHTIKYFNFRDKLYEALHMSPSKLIADNVHTAR